MTLELVLEIIKLALEIVLQAMKDATPEQKAQIWKEHMQWVQFWDALAKKLAELKVSP